MMHKNRKLFFLLIALILVGFVISGCKPAEPTLDIDLQRTGFAQTANVQATMTAEAQPTATVTPEPSPTFTATAEVTRTPATTPTTTTHVTAAPVTGNDAAAWLANDPPDNADVPPGGAFTVTWTIENTGTSTWSMNYYIKFSAGAQMGAPEKVFLPYPVAPNKNVQISVNFVAPKNEGTVRSDWKLFNASDNSFYDFYITIDVVEGAEIEPDSAPEAPTPTETP